jgi:hypothetical protein
MTKLIESLMKDMLERVKTPEVQLAFHSNVVSPLFNYLFDFLFPYLVAILALWLIMFMGIVIILVMLLRKGV